MKTTSILSIAVLLLTTAPALAVGTGRDARVRVVHASPDAPAVDVLVEGTRALTNVDFGEVTEMDSSALALCLAWLRDARAAGSAITFSNLPESLQTIARLYGVHSLLPVR